MSFDALHTNHATIERVVVEKGGDYLCQVKKNTPALYDAIETAFDRYSDDAESAESLDYGHGRIEHRELEIVPLSPPETGWPHTHLACRIKRDREQLRRGKTVGSSSEEAYYVSSLPFSVREPEKLLREIRGHWGIENRLHHVKDRSLEEDRCRASERGIGRAMSCIRSMVAVVSGRCQESTKVMCRRFSKKTHFLLKLLKSSTLGEWERSCKPYKRA